MNTRCSQPSEGKLSAFSDQRSTGERSSRTAHGGAPRRRRRLGCSCGPHPSSLVAYWRSCPLVLVFLVLPLLIGCSAAQKRKWERRTPEQNYTTALESPSADLRREAVVRIGESGYWRTDDAFDVLEAVARTDPVPQVRCIAIRILARYTDARPIEPMLAILTAGAPAEIASRPEAPAALPADDDVRWEAAKALLEMQRQRLLDEAQQNLACELFIQMQRADRSRNVRIVSTRALGEFQDRRVLMPLVRSLRHEDFMIADSAERCLTLLTGESRDYDADAWARWIEQTPDPFERAGQSPTSRPAGGDWWDQQERAWRKMLKLGND